MASNRWVATFLRTDADSHALLIQRVVLGAVMFPHGAQKLLGWFGGFGFSGTMGFFTNQMHLPWLVALLVVLAESFGAVMLIAGWATRLAAIGVSLVMIGAALTTHLGNGFFMNWFGTQKGEGFEFHLLALGLGVPLAIWGGGRFSVDSLIARAESAPPLVERSLR